MTLVVTLTPHGLQAAVTVSGAAYGNVFAAYPNQVFSPTLVPDNVVAPDNLPVHKAGLAKLIEARGVRLLYLPPYLPNFNPIGLAFNKLNPGCARPKHAPERPWKPSFRPPPTG